MSYSEEERDPVIDDYERERLRQNDLILRLNAAIARAEERAGRLEAALRASLSAADSHYAHWDAKGTAGANCPACIARREANDIARAALATPPEQRAGAEKPHGE